MVTDQMPPGWYYADGDPPGTQRYWDGAVWQGAPQMVGGVQPPAFATPHVQYPEVSQAVLALVMSILGWVACCGLTCPVGWWMANEELKGIDAGRRDPVNQGSAKAAQVIGAIGTIIIGLVVLAFMLPLIAAALAAGAN